MGPIAKLTGRAIGLTAEALTNRKVSPSPEPSSHAHGSGSAADKEPNVNAEYVDGSEASSDEDELSWDVDDALPSYEEVAGDQNNIRDVNELLQGFSQRHPDATHPTARGRLEHPVVLPQRRPEHKDRGFVRAYAPELQACGIDESTWFDFLDGFQKAMKMHPVFHAVNLAVMGAAITVHAVAGPSIIARAAAITLHISVEASRRTFIVYETNKYLDGMNEKFFKLHGLYAMIMMYKPESKDAVQTIDPSTKIAGSVAARNDGAGGKFKQSSGKLRDELEIMEVAPLVYPEFEAMPEEEKKSKLKSMGSTLLDYNDRRQQALFDYNNPDSKLSSTPRKEFASRFSDPTHPVNDGSLIALLTGGKRSGIRTRMRGGFKPGGARRGRVRRKLLKQDILYLMVVNMPSEEELRKASEELAAA